MSYNYNLNKILKNHYEDDALIVISDVSRKSTLIYSAIFVSNKSAHLVKGHTSPSPGENLEVQGLHEAFKNYNEEQKYSNLSSIILVTDQHRKALSVFIDRLEFDTGLPVMAFKVTSHHSSIHNICDIECKNPPEAQSQVKCISEEIGKGRFKALGFLEPF